MHFLARAAAIVAGIAAISPAASYAAGSASGNVSVSAMVNANCTVATNPLPFGTYDPLVANTSTGKAASTNIVVTCTSGTTHSVTVSGQRATTIVASPNQSVTSILEDSTSHTLSYTATMETPTITSGLTRPTTWTLDGLIGPNQDVRVGDYSDTLVVTVDFGAPSHPLPPPLPTNFAD